MDSGLTPEYVSELLQRQDALQAEARALVAELDLYALLGRLGEVQQLGSSVSGLMVWRDIDFTAICPDLASAQAFDALRPLLANPRLLKLEYSNELGERSPTGRPEDQRYYFVLHYLSKAGHEWKLDITLWYTDAPRTQLAYLDYLKAQMTDEKRLAILWLKDVWRREPTYPYEVGGVEIYDAVLEHGIRTPEQFNAYLRERGLPGRTSTGQTGGNTP